MHLLLSMEVDMHQPSLLVIALALAGCAQLPPSPQDVQAKRFEPVPGQSVIYVVRTPLDSSEPQSLRLNEVTTVTTYPGTYVRIEVAPGRQHLQGSGFGGESLTLTTQPGAVYFLEHTVVGDPDDGGVQMTGLRQVNEGRGRDLVARSELVR
jgi:hypothetical protein